MSGMANKFPVFRLATAAEIVNALTNFVRDFTPEQIRARRNSIPPLQRQWAVLLDEGAAAQGYRNTAVLGCSVVRASRPHDP